MNKREVLEAAMMRWLSERPIIIGVEDYGTDPMKRAFADAYVRDAYGYDLERVFRIVVGERNLWVWEYCHNEHGHPYVDETGEAAYEVHRLDFENTIAAEEAVLLPASDAADL